MTSIALITGASGGIGRAWLASCTPKGAASLPWGAMPPA